MKSIIDRYPDDGRGARFYRALRLRLAGLEQVADLFPEEGLIVDLGCGMGLLSHLLIERGPSRRVLSVDHDQGRIHALLASAQGLPIKTMVADMSRIELPACHGIALVDVLHYLDRAGQEDLLRRSVEALEPGGVIVLRDPDAGAGLRYKLARLHERVAVGTGLTKATLASFRSGAEWAFVLRAHGLQAEELPLSKLSPYADRIVVGRGA